MVIPQPAAIVAAAHRVMAPTLLERN
jgi:hypothetical protein